MFSFSDRFQEYKQKHLERKAAALKELGIKLPNHLAAAETVTKGEKTSDQDTGCVKEAGEEGNPAAESTSEIQQEKLLEGAAKVAANGHEMESSELSKTVVERAASDDLKVKAENKPQCTEMKSGSGEKSEINGTVDIIASPSVHKSQMTWADVVSKPTVANETGAGKTMAVNGVDNGVTASTSAEE